MRMVAAGILIGNKLKTDNMKKNLSILAMAAIALASCQNQELPVGEELFSGHDDFLAVTESYEKDTRTALTEENRVVWSEGDQLAIFQAANIADTYEISEESVGGTEGVFSLVNDNSGDINGDFSSGMEINANIAVYPYEDDLNCSTNVLEESTEGKVSYTISNVTLPAIQEYVENSFSNGVFTMVAVTGSVADHNLKFKNVLGALKLQLCGTCTVKSIEVVGNKGEVLAGDAVIVAYPGEDAPTVSMAEDGEKSVILDCGDGIELDPAAPTSFIVALPPVNFVAGFTVKITDTEDNEMILENKAPNVIERSSILKMPKLSIPLTQPDDIIVFDDGIVEELCLAAFDTNKDNELSYEEAAAVTDLSVLKLSGKAIKWFNEFQYFTAVTKIPSSMFSGCTALRSIVLPDGIIEIGSYAFSSCSSLKEIILPESLTTIGSNAFSSCKDIKSMIIPNTVNKIDDGAFNNCTSLSSITLSNNISSIEAHVFSGCTSLLSVNIPKGVTYIEDRAFSGCTSLISVDLPDGLIGISKGLYDNAGAFQDCISLSSITIPETVEFLGNYTFSGCSSLTQVNIPEKVSELKYALFRGCSSLGAIEIPKGITSISDGVFSGCSSLESVIFKGNRIDR